VESEEEEPWSMLGTSATSEEEDPGSMTGIFAISEEDPGSMPGISATTEEEGGGPRFHTRDLQPVPWLHKERKLALKKEIWVIDMIEVFIQGSWPK
jgi:hypothetical protein